MRMRKAAGTVAALVLLVSLLTTGCAVKPVINDDPESRDFYCEVIMDEAGKMNTMVKNTAGQVGKI